MLVDQVGGTGEDGAGGGELDRVVGDLGTGARVAVDPPGEPVACDRVGRFGDPE